MTTKLRIKKASDIKVGDSIWLTAPYTAEPRAVKVLRILPHFKDSLMFELDGGIGIPWLKTERLNVASAPPRCKGCGTCHSCLRSQARAEERAVD